ncbi:hypothetical protein ONZ45_g403 [Pleurotus djamor]|nr:hypothetical protein ONZ45_g403 [Pleurotus djamor]
MDAPISRVPPELLGEIFCHCTAFCPDAPIILSAVCSNFRDVVRVTPPVWTRFRITFRRNSEHRTKEASKAALWFEMARNCPMSLYVALNGVEDIPEPSRPLVGGASSGEEEWYADYFSRVPCAKTIQDNVPRIQGLSIRSSSERAAHKFLHFLYPSSLYSQSLHRLTVNVTGDSPIPPPSLTAPFVSQSQSPSNFLPLPELPSLRNLKLTNHSFPHTSINLANLQCFSFIRPLRASPIPYLDILRCLHSNPALVDVQIECRLSNSEEATILPTSKIAAATTTAESEEADPEEAPRVFALPHLTHLSLRTNFLPLLVNALILPSLTHLNIDDLDGKNPEHHLGATIRGLIVRSALGTQDGSVPISSLSLTNACMFTHAITSWDGDEVPVWQWCFSRMLGLEYLAMMNTDASEHVGMLHLLADAASHMPSLEEDIEAGLSEAPRGREGSNRINSTRHSICPRLKSLKVAAPFVIDPAAVEKLRLVRPRNRY